MMARRTTRGAASVGVCAVLLSLALSGCEAYDLPLPGSPVDADESIEVTAEFRDVLNLVPRSPVKFNDVTVGEVVSIENDGWNAVATLRLREDLEVPDTSIAEIRQSSLLGEKYVSLELRPGKQGPPLRDGAVLPLSSTGRNPEVEEILGALGFLLNGGGVGQLKSITTELNAVFDGRQARIKHVVSELATLVGGLNHQKGDIVRALEALDELAGTLEEERRTVTTALDTLPGAVTVLADHRHELIGMLTALGRLGKVGTRVVNATKDDILADLRMLQPVLREINRAGATLPAALSLLISFPFPIESNDIVHGDYANTSIAVSADLNNLLDAVLPGGNLLDLSGALSDLAGGALSGLPGDDDGPSGGSGPDTVRNLTDLLGGRS